jgi:glucose/arabinose dehydrogenase
MRAIGMLVRICLLLVLAATPGWAQLRAQVIAQGLSSPVAFVPDPTSTTRFFIVEQGGLIRVLDGAQVLPTPFLDLRTIVLAGGEQGLLGMAFAPDAATSGRFFVNFTSRSGDIVVSRFQRTPANSATANAASRFDLIWPSGQPFIAHPTNTNHNGGHLAFGPDGYLYIGTGDGGSGNDPPNNAQNPLSLLGKMLRIDVNEPDSHQTGYSVPGSNPFVSFPASRVRHEIWAFGLRNPWRYTFDDFGAGATRALVIGDVGQGAREEVNYEPAGAGGRNYGWSLREGRVATPGIDPSRQPAYFPLIDPLFDYVRAIGQAVTGGYVYRGAQLPDGYRGRYFVADAITSVVGSVGINVNPATREATFVDAVDHTAELGGPIGGPVSFGRDREGELYLVASFSGRILKIVPADLPGVPTGLGAAVAGENVTLSWTPPAGGPVPTGYRLEAGSAEGTADIAVIDTGPTPALGVSHVPDGVYFIRVRARHDATVGPPSSDVQVVVEACPVPAPPASLTRGGSGNTVVLTWGPAAGALEYLVEAGSAPRLADRATLNAGAATSLTASAPNGLYFVRVRGLNGCGLGPPSNELQVQVP